MSSEPWDGRTERRRGERERLAVWEEIRDELVRARKELSGSIEREAQKRRRAVAAIGLPALVAALSGVVSLFTLSATNATTNRLEDCTIVGGKCYQELIESGQQGTARLMRYFRCVLSEDIPNRSEAVFDQCESEAFGDLLKVPGREDSKR